MSIEIGAEALRNTMRDFSAPDTNRRVLHDQI
jgi:hypothetical protein